MKQEFHVKQKFCLVNSYRNTISKWALGFRYRNFFIPRVEKNLKISPWEGNSNLPRAYGPWEDRVSSLGLIFGGFFNPWDEEISIPETQPIRKSLIAVMCQNAGRKPNGLYFIEFLPANFLSVFCRKYFRRIQTHSYIFTKYCSKPVL